MGEAKRRAESYRLAKENLLTAVQGNDRKIAESAISLFEGFVMPNRYTGGCYLTTMFLHRYLADECGIETEPVVGYINDGTDDIFMSHAWLEVEGRKTDLTVHLTDRPDVQLPGALVILDHVLRPGRVTHSYHRELTPAAVTANVEMAKEPQLAALLAHKQREHQEMFARASDTKLMAAYLAAAPLEFGYAAMRASIG